MTATPYDAVIVGGGPAGLNAALYLGRSRRRTVLIDSGDARNMAAGVMHNVPTNDGVSIADFRERARAEIAGYGVELVDGEVTSVSPDGDQVVTVTRSGTELRSRTVLYAAGVRSILPDLPGIADLWGKSVFECPYCHAYEVRDGAFGVYGGGVPSECLAATLTVWASSLTYLSDQRELPEDEQARLAAAGVPTVADKVLGLAGGPTGSASNWTTAAPSNSPPCSPTWRPSRASSRCARGSRRPTSPRCRPTNAAAPRCRACTSPVTWARTCSRRPWPRPAAHWPRWPSTPTSSARTAPAPCTTCNPHPSRAEQEGSPP